MSVMRTNGEDGGSGAWSTVSLSQLIQRGFTMLARVIAHAIEAWSAIAHMVRWKIGRAYKRGRPPAPRRRHFGGSL